MKLYHCVLYDTAPFFLAVSPPIVYAENWALFVRFSSRITLRGGNHMIKLTIAHAISQSVKLALYECQMDDTIDDTKIIPIRLAQTGKLNYSRPQITRISGHLFQLRMNVDLVSNVLGKCAMDITGCIG